MRRVMVVDDDALTRDVLDAVLDLDEYDVTTVPDGGTALEHAAQEPPDVVILDIMMPGLDGFEVCRRLKGDPATAGVAVVLLTARVDDEARAEAGRCGADAFLTKPFSPLELIEQLDQLVGA